MPPSKKILLISLLKPADEPRMYEHFGKTLLTAGYEVHLAGQNLSCLHSNTSNPIIFHPIFNFKRLNLKRLFAPVSVLLLTIRLNPEIIIISTPELLKIFFFYKLFRKVKVYYDIQENYFENIIHATWYPPVLNYILACTLRLNEWIYSKMFDGFFLAEKSYQHELPFIKNKKWIVLENKMWLENGLKEKITRQHFPKKKNYGDSVKFLFTGTLDEDTGIFSAIEITKKIHALYPQLSLDIVGSVTRESIFEKLQDQLMNVSYIRFLGSKQFVQHDKILSAILNADFGIIDYQPFPHIQHKIPSKLYEYLSCGLPIIINQNPQWELMVSTYQAGFSVPFKTESVNSIVDMLFKEFYPNGPVKESLWNTEENKLLNFLG
ncbi:MAG: hypothetical protein A3H98_14630 [Bacteroidetes bacterium RIFCSPLOWO2_02_FULL_36_8]|nr:MAG: hypothetical protein A3H98_14630 [Bacteroidetes bacterium RIFCSPLOWO2_02_FULL_36_8]OFY72129.1 MAG: hypothetical protein A3G23_07145 [Bacteroidetes bacterium RIFCSPLOWO2_12_FULL_37_12]